VKETLIPELGAQDDARVNSPIVDDEMLEEYGAGMPDTPAGACYFNDQPYAPGTYVRAGDELLCCDKAGFWVRKASLHE